MPRGSPCLATVASPLGNREIQARSVAVGGLTGLSMMAEQGAQGRSTSSFEEPGLAVPSGCYLPPREVRLHRVLRSRGSLCDAQGAHPRARRAAEARVLGVGSRRETLW